MGATAVGNGVLFAAFVTVPRMPLALACVALLAGILAVIWGASINTLLQTNVADRYLGRVFGAFSTTNAATITIGAGAAAVAGQGLGTANLLYIAAALYTLSGIVVLVTRPHPPEQPNKQSPRIERRLLSCSKAYPAGRYPSGGVP